MRKGKLFKGENVMLHVLRYSNIREVMEVKPSETNTDLWGEYLENYQNRGGIRWWGCEFNELEKIVRRGWLEGLRKMEEFKNKLEVIIPPPVVKRKKKRFGSEGDEIIPERFYQGEIERCWIGTKKIHAIQTGKMLTFKVCIANNSGTNSSEHFWTGAVCVVLTDILENIGYRVEIIGFLSSIKCTEQGDSLYIEIPIKKHDQSLDKESLITITALSGFFRFYLFRVINSLENKVRDGFGKADTFPPSEYQVREEHLISGIYNERTATSFISNILDKLKIKEDV